MTDINLLPWRELRRQQEKKNVMTLLISTIVITIIIILLVNYYCHKLSDGQTHRNQRLQNEITLLDKKIDTIKQLKKMREGLIARMKIVHELQATRTSTVHLFDELIKVLPDGVYLTDVKRTENKVILQGYTESNSNISILMRNIQNNPWLHAPKLTEIKKSKEISTDVDAIDSANDNEFNLSVMLGQLKKGMAYE
jgi:type IV pilus assembly protein PilN